MSSWVHARVGEITVTRTIHGAAFWVWAAFKNLTPLFWWRGLLWFLSPSFPFFPPDFLLLFACHAAWSLSHIFFYFFCIVVVLKNSFFLWIKYVPMHSFMEFSVWISKDDGLYILYVIVSSWPCGDECRWTYANQKSTVNWTGIQRQGRVLVGK